MSEGVTEDAPAPVPARPAAPGGGQPPAEEATLSVVPHLAVLGLFALVFGRVVAYALTGVEVGMGRLLHGVEVAGALTSQWFAVSAMMMAILVVLVAARSRLPVGVRMAALVLGGFAVLPTVWALHQQVPDLSAALVAASASLLALAAVPTCLRTPFARAPGLVIGLVALGGVVRLVAVGLAYQATTARHANLGSLARGVAAAALLCDAVAIAVALVWTASRGKKLYSPVTVAILAAALFLARQAMAGQSSDAHGLDLLCWRAAVRLLSRPDAALPLGFRVFVSFLAPLAAMGALATRGTLAPLGAAVALALAARGAVEMPPCALMLMVAALTAALTARDPRSLWASLDRARADGERPT